MLHRPLTVLALALYSIVAVTSTIIDKDARVSLGVLIATIGVLAIVIAAVLRGRFHVKLEEKREAEHRGSYEMKLDILISEFQGSQKRLNEISNRLTVLETRQNG